MAKGSTRGFTLIELSIALVIIGLVAGGVLVGQSLIGSAAVRAQISQIARYNTAANTFREKYGYLPGDILPSAATQFGFTIVPGSTRAGTKGLGDGNGLIDGINYSSSTVYPVGAFGGEQAWFWEDLSSNSHLIPDSFSTAVAVRNYTGTATGSAIALLVPQAKLGNGNYISIYNNNGSNYFFVSATTAIDGSASDYFANPGLTVQQAAALDTKMDDGNPQTGQVTAQYVNFALGGAAAIWAAGSGVGASPGAVAAPSATSCYDNGGNSSNPMAYSLAQNNGNGINCALSFRMQAGD